MRTVQRGELGELTVFVEVARSGGFRAAAKRLELSPSSVSEVVRRFEDRVGVRLLDRTTRRVALTEVGRALYERCLPSIADIEGAMHELVDKPDRVDGVLRLSAPSSAGPLFLDRLVAAYLAAYPEVEVELSYDDRKVDLVASGLDAAIRASPLLEQDAHAVPVGPPLQMAVVASPDYLGRHPAPRHPEDLAEHDGIRFRIATTGALAPWTFEGADGPLTVEPRPRAVVNDVGTILCLAEAGVGVAYLYRAAAASSIAAGRLVVVLEGQAVTLARYAVSYVSKRHMSSRLRAFIDMAKRSAAAS